MAQNGIWGEVRELKNLSIGLGSDIKVIEHNVFEITGGDISIEIESAVNKFVNNKVEKLKVIYNHDGLLEHIYRGKNNPDSVLLIKDVETYVAQSYNTMHYDGDDFYEDINLSDSKAIEVYADFMLITD